MGNPNKGNPFVFGNPVRKEKGFFNRERELRSLKGRILKGGSALVTAEPRFGKTSLLLRLMDPDLYGEAAAYLHLRYLDAQTLFGWDVPRFWAEALQPVRTLTPAVEEAFRAAEKERFGTFVLERLFVRLEEAGERLVLLVDEFDAVLDIPGLHSVEFYGGLRSLASRFASLSLVLASRWSVTALNEATRDFSRLSSPYFNFMHEISLGPLPQKAVAALLAQAKERFDGDDRRFLERVSGGQPYFLQATAYFLWEARGRGLQGPQARREAGKQSLEQTRHILRDTWRLWSPYHKMAFTLAALDAFPRLLQGRKFDVGALRKSLPDLSPEQRELARRGFLRADSDRPGEYALQAELMLWFLADELTTLLRPSKPDVAAWLQEQEWDGILKRGAQKRLQKAIGGLKPLLQEGVSAIIEAAAKGVVGALPH